MVSSSPGHNHSKSNSQKDLAPSLFSQVLSWDLYAYQINPNVAKQGSIILGDVVIHLRNYYDSNMWIPWKRSKPRHDRTLYVDREREYINFTRMIQKFVKRTQLPTWISQILDYSRTKTSISDLVLINDIKHTSTWTDLYVHIVWYTWWSLNSINGSSITLPWELCHKPKCNYHASPLVKPYF